MHVGFCYVYLLDFLLAGPVHKRSLGFLFTRNLDWPKGIVTDLNILPGCSEAVFKETSSTSLFSASDQITFWRDLNALSIYTVLYEFRTQRNRIMKVVNSYRANCNKNKSFILFLMFYFFVTCINVLSGVSFKMVLQYHFLCFPIKCVTKSFIKALSVQVSCFS